MVSSSKKAGKRRAEGEVAAPTKKRRHVGKGENGPIATWFDDERYSDLTIKAAGGIVFRCHRIVLATRCRFFELCCGGGFAEAESKEINLEDDDPEALRKMLIYLYTLNIDHVLLQGEEDEPPETPTTYLEGLLDLFVLADKYELPELSDLITVAVDAFDRGGYRASQFIRAYLKAVSMPDSTLGRSRLLTKLTSALESFRRGWHNVCPIGVEDNETRNRNYAKTVDAVVENPEAAVLLICHLGNMLTVAKAAHVDFEDASRTFDDKSSESAVSTPGADGNSGSASDFSVFDDEDEDTDASSFEWFKVEDEAVLKATSLPKDED